MTSCCFFSRKTWKQLNPELSVPRDPVDRDVQSCTGEKASRPVSEGGEARLIPGDGPV